MNLNTFVPKGGERIKNERTEGPRWINYFPVTGMVTESIKLHEILFFVTKII